MAKPRTAPPSAPKTAQDDKPAEAPAVTEEKAADASPAKDGSVPEEGSGEPESASSAVSAANGAAVDQPQGDQVAADQDVGNGAEASAPDAASLDAAAPATATAGDDNAPSTWCFEVLSPFKHNGVVIKPPAWIEMTWDEAEDYQDAGVLGDEPAAPEELE
ncbi:hypothetical protein D7Y32_01880 [Stenotrophomonas maltophilia]|uniref:Uncharacterized protein n=1 Tax=Stenotrophomonas maltophilia TaxID=40324 RepID=A0A2W6KGK4_STEMA|nr:hypothetical protein [Stenotrophomonas maltophilia]MBA0258701.1 hypothetical protein [Stenotrophomonas maltophilia]MBH1667998.1 hypothetical protein [Stenotrophomonas maltophilia]MBN5153308.1 hypothetical protein [Stenotrophomonas maltophilia]PZS94332.1 hypothetical protein A7X83_04975 [Stenotrophomonas maltophilia]